MRIDQGLGSALLSQNLRIKILSSLPFREVRSEDFWISSISSEENLISSVRKSAGEQGRARTLVSRADPEPLEGEENGSAPPKSSGSALRNRDSRARARARGGRKSDGKLGLRKPARNPHEEFGLRKPVRNPPEEFAGPRTRPGDTELEPPIATPVRAAPAALAPWLRRQSAPATRIQRIPKRNAVVGHPECPMHQSLAVQPHAGS